ncbi:HEPN domain-containing protein [Paenibacillus septentrionalis]|uniref:HEPN domain-containing protein n=1 Tax=Paenibacillus septentrionalis TaxID=429342 RepID=A0ABW1V573_9BACL
MRYLKAVEVMGSKAEQKFKLAEFSFSSGMYDSCVSALYYSAFQYVTALILARGEKVSNNTPMSEAGSTKISAQQDFCRLNL